MRFSPPRRRRQAGVLVSALVFLALLLPAAGAAAGRAEAPYPDDKAIGRDLERLARQDGRVRLQELARSPGDRAIRLVTVLPAAGGAEGAPAVLVIADPDGTAPLATRAALDLCRLLVQPAPAAPAAPAGPAAAVPTWSAAELTWHIVPTLDPDGAARLGDTPLGAEGRNGRAWDDDKDGASDEDGPDDLDGDGLIATMLVRLPDGRWLLSDDDPPLPRLADPALGERGLYAREIEGRDDDGDGLRNEDGPGGVVPGRNFPHGFTHWTGEGGLWPASEPESRAVLRFAFDHPEIAMILILGHCNTLAKAPEADKKGEAGGGKYKLPEWMARRMGIDLEQEFPLEALVQMARDFTGQKDLTADDVLGFLELGAAVNPSRKDLAWWDAMSERYRERLKEAGRDGERVEPPAAGPGAPQEWAYFQFGVPAFAVDFWSVPKPKDAAAADTAAAAGETPPTPDRPRKKDERAGKPDAELAALAAFARAHPEARAWLPWREVTLPDGREALVGGPAPLAMRTPPPAMVDSLLAPQVPWLLELPGWLPRLEVAEIEIEPRGGDVYQVTAWIANRGRIPYPTHQGKRTRRPGPVVVTLAGAEVLEGRARATIEQIEGLSAESRRWLVRIPRGARLTVTAEAPAAGRAARTAAPARQGGHR